MRAGAVQGHLHAIMLLVSHRGLHHPETSHVPWRNTLSGTLFLKMTLKGAVSPTATRLSSGAISRMSTAVRFEAGGARGKISDRPYSQPLTPRKGPRHRLRLRRRAVAAEAAFGWRSRQAKMAEIRRTAAGPLDGMGMTGSGRSRHSRCGRRTASTGRQSTLSYSGGERRLFFSKSRCSRSDPLADGR